MKNYYLGRVDTYFTDPHGTSDDGGTVMFVTKTDYEIDTTKIYKEKIDQFENGSYEEMMNDPDRVGEYVVSEDHEYEGSEDGYNAEDREFEYKKITQEEYFECQKVIDTYDNLLNTI